MAKNCYEANKEFLKRFGIQMNAYPIFENEFYKVMVDEWSLATIINKLTKSCHTANLAIQVLEESDMF